MKRFNFKNWHLLIDPDSTREILKNIKSDGESCSCIYCINFISARDKAFEEDFLFLMKELGIDIKKDIHTSHIVELEDGIHLYEIDYYFAGEIISRPSISEPTVRAPDVAFKSNERLSKGGITKGYSTIMPDLVIEVNSPGDSHGKVINKVNEWLLSGVRQVWVIDPDDKSVIVYNKPGQYVIILKDNILDGGDLLPGFKCRVSDIFDIN